MALVAASAAGMRQALSPTDREELRRAGMGHLIAVSGLHVALVGLLVQSSIRRVCAFLSVSSRGGLLLSWFALWAFVAFSGANPPAVRAAVMVTLLGVGEWIGRPSTARPDCSWPLPRYYFATPAGPSISAFSSLSSQWLRW